MAAGECCRGALASFLGRLHEGVEQSVGVARRGKALLVTAEICAEAGEYAVGDAVDAHGAEIERGASDGDEDEDDVIEEERPEDDEGRTVELL